MRGIIENVWENESKNGQQYVTVQIGGERYSVWDKKYFDQLQEGIEIDYEVRESGNFKNLNDIRPVERPNQTGNYTNHKDKQITRLSCLKSASEILALAHLDIDIKRDMVIDTARYFERYVLEEDTGSLTDLSGDEGAGKG